MWFATHGGVSRYDGKEFKNFTEKDGLADNLVYGDENKLRQVLLNLLSNAVKFTESGEVKLRISEPVPSNFTFEIIDTGIGIPKKEQSIYLSAPVCVLRTGRCPHRQASYEL